MTSTQQLNWPDLSIDQRAWDLAKRTAQPGEPLTVLVQRAEEIKRGLKENENAF
jgi:hypothetical protein